MYLFLGEFADFYLDECYGKILLLYLISVIKHYITKKKILS